MSSVVVDLGKYIDELTNIDIYSKFQILAITFRLLFEHVLRVVQVVSDPSHPDHKQYQGLPYFDFTTKPQHLRHSIDQRRDAQIVCYLHESIL
ncbi:hypothetical protein BSLG_001441 [Batrachochytrium salamandrivorans]|nr:hypothetical protein BSLG_001441 [Batrachochytrium salamandrivorans]